MNSQQTVKMSITESIAQARQAFDSGRLVSYKPLAEHPVDSRSAAQKASWGPMMKK